MTFYLYMVLSITVAHVIKKGDIFHTSMADLKENFSNKQEFGAFIKVTDEAVATLNTQQKALLNRKGNALFNAGDVEQARRIFMATGYSDGLTRVGDVYMKNNETVKALKQYILAKNKNKTELMYEKLASAVSVMLQG